MSAISVGFWSLLAFAGAVTIYRYYRSIGTAVSFSEILGLQLSQTLTYAPLTPLVFGLTSRYPILRSHLLSRLGLYVAGGVSFVLVHNLLRGITPFAYWDEMKHAWYSAFWDFQVHAFRLRWDILRTLLYRNVVDDISGTYVPIVLVAYTISHYRRNREQEHRASLLEAQLARANMQALKAQLQPHFLFNTLHSISALMLQDVNEADRMISRLSELLRMSLENGNSQITTLGQELEFVTAYLEIEKIRFGDKLSITYAIPDETLDAQVPHLLLQPLVENAVKHGVARLSCAPGQIRIGCEQIGESLRLSVADNGPGLSEKNASATRTGLGLRATRERLETLYGNEQAFCIANGPQGGTEVSVRLPFHLMLS